jgi:hypothetical protein
VENASKGEDMTVWKRTSSRNVVTGFFLIAAFTFVVICKSVASDAASALQPQRVLKFKTSDAKGLDLATQIRFRPSAASTMQVSVQSGDKTIRIEFTVKSDFTPDAVAHTVKARYMEQIGKSKPEILRKPQIRTLEGVPAVLQINDFLLEILIEPVL